MEEYTNVENDKLNMLNKKLFKNIVIAILIMLYFIFINLGSFNIENDIFLTDIKVFSIIILGISIIIFENAYKKDSSELALYGIETLVLACHTLSMKHITNVFKLDFNYYILTSAYIFSIYYVFKDILIYTKDNKKKLENLSDISDIVKKEEPSKKEAKKKVKLEEKEIQFKITKQEDKQEKQNKGQSKSKNSKEKTEANSKKQSGKKKITKIENDKTVEKNKSSKPTSKVKKTKKEDSKEDRIEQKQEQDKPKRGRPKKKVEK